MPYKASSPSTSASSAHTEHTDRHLFFKRDLKENGVWLFVLSLLFLLAEPFILYLTGATSADLSKNQLWGYQLGKSFADFSHIIQSAVLASLLILGITFLAYRLFAFLFDKDESNFYLSLPFSRASLFCNRYVAGLVLISLAFLIELLVMLLIFYLPPANLAPYIQDWLSLRLNLYLASLAFFSSLAWCFSLVGHFMDGILAALGLNFILPLLLLLLRAFVRDSVSGYLDPQTENFIRVLSAFTPGLQLYMPREGLMDGLLSLSSWILWGGLGLAAFRRRPAERAGNRLASMPHSWPLSLLYTFLGGSLGGLFIEKLTYRQTIFYYLAGFVLFACLAHLLYQVLIQGPVKGAGRSFAMKVLAALVLMIAFDLAVETYPAEASRYWQEDDVVSADLELNQAIRRWSILDGQVKLHVDKATAPEALSALLKAYQDGPHLSQRQGFINDAKVKIKGEGYRTQSLNTSIQIEFARKNGRKDTVNYYYLDSEEIIDALASSQVYEPLALLDQTDYLPGDKIYFELTLYDDESHLEAFNRLIDRLDAYPYFQPSSGEEFMPNLGLTVKQPAQADDPTSQTQLANRERGRASLLLAKAETQELVRLIKQDQAQMPEDSQLSGEAKLNHYREEADSDFDQQLAKIWPGQTVNLALHQYREITIPGLSGRPYAMAYQSEAEQLDSGEITLDSLRLENYPTIFEPAYTESQAYILQLLQGEVHD